MRLSAQGGNINPTKDVPNQGRTQASGEGRQSFGLPDDPNAVQSRFVFLTCCRGEPIRLHSGFDHVDRVYDRPELQRR